MLPARRDKPRNKRTRVRTTAETTFHVAHEHQPPALLQIAATARITCTGCGGSVAKVSVREGENLVK
jgi:hypothetical protein